MVQTSKLASKKGDYSSTDITWLWVSGILLVAYAVLIPAFDISYKVAVYIGKSFYPLVGLTTIEANIALLSLIPLIIFAIPGGYILSSGKGTNKHRVIYTTITSLIIASFTAALYWLLSFHFGFKYHYVF